MVESFAQRLGRMGYEYELISETNPRFSKWSYHEADNEDRRWSVGTKFASRYYCRIRSCEDCLEVIRPRCVFSTLILVLFISLVILTIHSYLVDFGFINVHEDNFDFIIVGSGPAGSVLSRKLLDAGNSVLLLEAGGPTQANLGGSGSFGAPTLTRFDVPFNWPSIIQYPEYIWQGLKKKNVLLGKGMGGSGAMNAMIYIRCTKNDIDRWNMNGEEGGWNWENIYKEYISLENFIPDNAKTPKFDRDKHDIPSFHGDGSTPYAMHTIRPGFRDPASELFVASALSANLSYIHDFNDPRGRRGVGYFHFNIKNGVRDSAASSFLGPVFDSHSHLNISMYSEVRRILFEDGSSDSKRTVPPKAIGVEYVKDGKIRRAYLNKHLLNNDKLKRGAYSVILSAGAIHSPKILLNSGIGPRQDLENLGKPVVSDVAGVGKNLQDHPTIYVDYQLSSFQAAEIPTAYDAVNQWRQYVLSTVAAMGGGDVPFDSYGFWGSPGFSSGAFLKSPFSSSGDPDIQLTISTSNTGPYEDDSVAYSKHMPGIDIMVTLTDPDARYEVVLDESNPMDPPLIQLPKNRSEYLSERDVKTFEWGITVVRDIAAHQPMRSCIVSELAPGPGFGPREMKQWIHENALPNSHWVGTARMGRSRDASAVVDSHLKVRGVDNLRVVDASVIPHVPSGNVHSVVVVTASRAADLIIDELNGINGYG